MSTVIRYELGARTAVMHSGTHFGQTGQNIVHNLYLLVTGICFKFLNPFENPFQSKHAMSAYLPSVAIGSSDP